MFYYGKLILVAILFGCAFTHALQEYDTSTIQLKMFEGSSQWWMAVMPLNDNGLTISIEIQDADASFVTMPYNAEWGFYSYTTKSVRGFSAPLTFRLTSSDGSQRTVQVNEIVPGAEIKTNVRFDRAIDTETDDAPDDTVAAIDEIPVEEAESEKSGNAAAPRRRPHHRTTSATSSSAGTTTTGKPATSTASSISSTASSISSTASSISSTATTKSSTSTIGSSNSGTTGLCDIVPTSSEPLKLLVPLYTYPGSAWDELVAAASQVKIIAIINPNSGPASSADSSYITYMTKLKNAGVDMVGYVYTSYGSRAISAVQSDIDTYASNYPYLSGIFFDEVSDSAGQISFYTQAYNYVKSKSGYVHVILNPGVQPDSGYVSISTSIVIFENYGSSVTSSSYASWVTCAPNASAKSGYKYHFAGIAHTTAQSNAATYINDFQNKGMGLVYVTDGAGGCCTYNTLVSYFAAEATIVASI